MLLLSLGNTYDMSTCCVFAFTKGQLSFVRVLAFFISANFLIDSYLVNKIKNKKKNNYFIVNIVIE